MKLIRSFKVIWQKHQSWLALALAVLGGAVYAWQSWGFAHQTSSIVLDESLYLYKGYLFASQVYRPFQDYGPFTDHMPLSYTIPGLAQTWFGPGLRTGRYFAVGLGLLALTGFWLSAKRLGGNWWGAAIVWVIALNSTWIRFFSMGFSQVVVNVFLAWMMVFAIGDRRKHWHLVLAAILAGLAGMTRINVLPILAFFLLYVFWQHGKKAGWMAAAAGGATVFITHAVYWPDILKLWAYWLPTEIFPFIEPHKSPVRQALVPETFGWWPLNAWVGDRTHLVWKSLSSFWTGVGFNFVPLFGGLSALVLWRRREKETADFHFKFSVFIAVSFTFLLLIHMWAALGGNSCAFSCFGGYLMFFDGLALLLVIGSYSSWRKDMPNWQQVLIFSFVFLLFAALINNQNPDFDGIRKLILDFFDKEVPRVKGFQIQPGTVPLWVILENKFGFDYYPLHRFVFYERESFRSILRWVVLIGIFGGIVPILYRLSKRVKLHVHNFGRFTLLFFLGSGVVFASAPLFSGAQGELSCGDDVLASHERVAVELEANIPANSTVFWDVKSSILLLYFPGVEIFPALLHNEFTYVESSGSIDSDELVRFGFWDDELGQRWIQAADLIAVEYRFFDQDWQQRVDSGEFEVIFTSSPVESCRGKASQILLLANIP